MVLNVTKDEILFEVNSGLADHGLEEVVLESSVSSHLHDLRRELVSEMLLKLSVLDYVGSEVDKLDLVGSKQGLLLEFFQVVRCLELVLIVWVVLVLALTLTLNSRIRRLRFLLCHHLLLLLLSSDFVSLLLEFLLGLTTNVLNLNFTSYFQSHLRGC